MSTFFLLFQLIQPTLVIHQPETAFRCAAFMYLPSETQAAAPRKTAHKFALFPIVLLVLGRLDDPTPKAY